MVLMDECAVMVDFPGAFRMVLELVDPLPGTLASFALHHHTCTRHRPATTHPRTIANMSTIMRTLRNLRSIGLKVHHVRVQCV